MFRRHFNDILNVQTLTMQPLKVRKGKKCCSWAGAVGAKRPRLVLVHLLPGASLRLLWELCSHFTHSSNTLATAVLQSPSLRGWGMIALQLDTKGRTHQKSKPCNSESTVVWDLWGWEQIVLRAQQLWLWAHHFFSSGLTRASPRARCGEMAEGSALRACGSLCTPHPGGVGCGVRFPPPPHPLAVLALELPRARWPWAAAAVPWLASVRWFLLPRAFHSFSFLRPSFRSFLRPPVSGPHHLLQCLLFISTEKISLNANLILLLPIKIL